MDIFNKNKPDESNQAAPETTVEKNEKAQVEDDLFVIHPEENKKIKIKHSKLAKFVQAGYLVVK